MDESGVLENDFRKLHAEITQIVSQRFQLTTLRVLGQRESGTERLEEAVEAYRAALQERTPERV